MGRKSFSPKSPGIKSPSAGKGSTVKGIKNSGGGGVTQPNIKPHKSKTNP